MALDLDILVKLPAAGVRMPSLADLNEAELDKAWKAGGVTMHAQRQGLRGEDRVAVAFKENSKMDWAIYWDGGDADLITCMIDYDRAHIEPFLSDPWVDAYGLA